MSVVETLFGFSTLSLEERARLAVREAQSEMSPRWVEVMRSMSPARKLENANALYLAARDALYFQERRNGLDERSARPKAAQRLLMSHDRESCANDFEGKSALLYSGEAT